MLFDKLKQINGVYFVIIFALFALFIYAQMSLSITAYPDTFSYIRLRNLNILSINWWETLSSGRPFTIPVLYWMLQSYESIAIAQALCSFFAWILFSCCVASFFLNKYLKYFVFIFLALWMFGENVMVWNTVMISDSFSLSLLLIWLSALLRLEYLIKYFGGYQMSLVFCFLFLTAVASFTRDTNTYLIPFAIPLIIYAYYRSNHLKTGIILSAGIVALCVVQIQIADANQRYKLPLINVIGTRILPFKNRLDYFASNGMPVNDKVLCFKGAMAPKCKECFNGFWTDDYNDELKKEWTEFRLFIKNKGKSVYQKFLISHPLYLFGEPLKVRTQVLHMDLMVYADTKNINATLKFMKKLSFPLGRKFDLLFIVFIVSISYMLITGYSSTVRHYPTLFALTLFVMGLANLIVAYHGDAGELQRHCVIAAIFIKLGVIITVLFTIPRMFKSMSAVLVR